MLAYLVETELGPWAMLGTPELLQRFVIGHRDIPALLKALREHAVEVVSRSPSPLWTLTKQLWQRYASGKQVDFSGLLLDESHLSPFQRSVVQACRQVSWGETITYGELARQAGFPQAHRAAGSVMSHNRFPIVVPCHRIVAAGGKLGGFSAPNGINLKRTLLEHEQALLPAVRALSAAN